MNGIRFGICILLLFVATTANSSELQARLLLSDPIPYVGETVTLTLEVDRPRPLTGRLQPAWPPFTGFQVSEPWSTGTRTLVTSGNNHRAEYRLRTIRPLSAGSFPIRVGVKTADGTSQTEAQVLVIVQPLPDFGKPVGFQGAVGLPEMVLHDSGEGRRLVELVLRGKLDLAALPLPQPVTEEQSTLGLLTDRTTGRLPAEQTRRLQYFYDPRGSSSAPGFRLPVFDPETGRYQVLTTGVSEGSNDIGLPGTTLLLVSSLILGFWIVKFRRIRHSVARTTDPGHYPPRKIRLRELGDRGVSSRTLRELESHWLRFDESRFGKNGDQGDKLLIALRHLNRRCVQEIDKSAMNQSISRIVKLFFH